MLRDTQGVASSHVLLGEEHLPVVARFDGRATCAEIARAASRETGRRVPTELVVQLATELEEALFVEGDAYRQARARAHAAFRSAAVRPASHAGGSYHADPLLLGRYLDESCLGTDRHGEDGGDGHGPLVGLIAPHIDPWRGARCYGHAYRALARALARQEGPSTFILFGTSHAPMRRPFALCRKAFETPLGRVEVDGEAVDAIAAASGFDVYEDEFNHAREHSLEFQAVFLRHLLGDRAIRIVPVLASLGASITAGASPRTDGDAERFLDAVSSIVERQRAVVIAGADLAHVGPRFGDEAPLSARDRDALEGKDRASLGHAAEADAEGFWDHVRGDLDTRRVCGLAPIYALLRTMRPTTRGHLAHYEQTIDPEEGSIVSHAAMGFYAR